MSREDDVKKLAELIRGVKVATMTTVAGDGTLRSRPMAALEREFDGSLWFFTRADSPKVAHVAHDQQVNVSYTDPQRQRYVSLSGAARLVEDVRRVKELWSPELAAWFPKGPADPNLALLRIDVVVAEYWEGPANAPVQALLGENEALV